jgi:DNA-binding NarL/FixJ family response regulator
MFREGLRRLLESEHGFSVAGEATSGEDAIAQTRKLAVDILLLNFNMPDMGGIEVIRDLNTAGLTSRTKIILLSDEGIQPSDLTQALQMGARGVVVKSSSTQLLLKAIRLVASGEYWIGRDAMTHLVESMRAGVVEFGNDTKYGLSMREKEVALAVAEGLTNKQIARKFSLSEDTVKHHLTNIFEKLNVGSRLELGLFVINNRLREAA